MLLIELYRFVARAFTSYNSATMNRLFPKQAWRRGGSISLFVIGLLVACGSTQNVPAAIQPLQTSLVRPTIVRPTIILPSPRSTAPPIAPTALPAPADSPAPAPALLLPIDPLPPVDLGFDGTRAYAQLEAYMQFQPRDTGSPGNRQAGDYIIAEAQKAGWTVEEQRFEYQGALVRNIIAKRGSGPVLMLGAHYDGRKRADQDADPARRNDPMPGANDGGSGVAILLELARQINTDQLGREVWLTFFDAEDNGRLDGWEYVVGSKYMAGNLAVRPEALVLLDMVGDKDLQVYYEVTSTSELSRSIWQSAAELGYQQFVPQAKYSIIDDHTAFLQAGIPAVDLIDFDYPAWHTTGDTADQVSAESLEAVGRTVERWLDTRAQP